MLAKLRDGIIKFAQKNKTSPTICAIASGMFPLAFYYYRNFTLINSWSQFLFFSFYFLLIPILVFEVINFMFNRIKIFKSLKKYLLTFLNLSWCVYLLVFITIGFNWLNTIIAIFTVVTVTLILYKYLNKAIVFQLILACVIFIYFTDYLIRIPKNPSNWLEQPDEIEKVILKNKPNIYFIQPDGYANSTEISKGYYNYDNSEFENFLIENNFKIYSDYRSNYYSTLSSNSSLFAMKHHYYNKPSSRITELFNARDVIVGANPVLTILKNNNYSTNLLLDTSYLLKNRPNIAYDYCNFNYEDLSYFSKGLQSNRDVFLDLKERMKLTKNGSNFYFIEKLCPTHITTAKNPGNIADLERDKYLKRLEESNIWLKKLLTYIHNNDDNSIVIIASDHGGFVGFNSMIESRTKQTNRDLIYSIFTAQLAIKWPDGYELSYDNKIKTPVNLFRVLFSILSENEIYLNHLQEDKSFIQINDKAPVGVYEYINRVGEVVFEEYKEDM